MGWDRVRFYDGPENKSTLMCADKCSAGAVYSRHFKRFLEIIGFTVTYGVDEEKPGKENAAAIARGAKLITFPAKSKIPDRYDRINISNIVVQTEPPIDSASMRLIMRWCDVYCAPSDAGPLYLDHRGEHNGCTIVPTGTTACPAGKAEAEALAPRRAIQ